MISSVRALCLASGFLDTDLQDALRTDFFGLWNTDLQDCSACRRQHGFFFDFWDTDSRDQHRFFYFKICVICVLFYRARASVDPSPGSGHRVGVRWGWRLGSTNIQDTCACARFRSGHRFFLFVLPVFCRKNPCFLR